MVANNTTDLRYGVTGELGCKAPCRGATMTNITLEGEQTANGIAFVAYDIALVNGQIDQTKNGVYIVSTSAWQRAVWFDDELDAVPGTLLVTVEGTLYPNTIWETICADNPIVFDTSLITFVVKASGTNTGDLTIAGQNYLSLAAQVLTAAKIALANMANLAANSFIGNNTGLAATPLALTQAQATALLNVVVGDSGSGGTKGLVPAPAAGDAAAGKYLRADGAFAVPGLGLPGAIIAYAANSAPTGYLECNGAAISRATFSALFAIINITFGPGDGSTTFNIPDLRGYFIRGWANGGGVDSGRSFGSAQNDAFQGHYHNLAKYSGAPDGNFTATNYLATSANIYGMGKGSTDENNTVSVKAEITNGSNGTPRIASETRPINLALMYCIKY